MYKLSMRLELTKWHWFSMVTEQANEILTAVDEEKFYFKNDLAITIVIFIFSIFERMYIKTNCWIGGVYRSN